MSEKDRMQVIALAEGAVFSEDRVYRYHLRRRVGGAQETFDFFKPTSSSILCFVMLNPSTADETENDSTITRCMDYAERWGYGWLDVVNVSPFCATDRKEMLARGAEPEDVTALNLRWIKATAETADLVVLAYGADGVKSGRANRVLECLTGVSLNCLRITKEGHPNHPLYLPSTLKPIPFETPESAA